MRSIKRKLTSFGFGVAICAVAIGLSPSKAAELSLAARSWGGVVRSGTGADYARLASLKEGEPVTILGRTGVRWNNYEWFKIRYNGDKTGYQWGGILCGIVGVGQAHRACRSQYPLLF